MADCLIGLGSNLGDRSALLDRALATLSRHPRIRGLRASTYHRTPAVGGPEEQPEFLNAAARFETSLAPEELLESLQQCENDLGRRRSVRWGPRAVDLDILLYDQLTLATDALQVPHPRMAFRRFVLEPAVEVAADMVHPTIGWTLARLLEHLRSALPYTAIAGMPGDDRPAIVRDVCQDVQGELVSEPGDDKRLMSALRRPTGPCLETALEFLDRRAAWLRRMEAASSSDGRQRDWISDFSLDQMPGLVEPHLPLEATEAWHRRWALLQSQLPRPRLLVTLGGTAESVAEAPLKETSNSGEKAAAEAWRIGQASLRALAGSRAGPVLALRGVSSDRAREEVTAAIRAMQ